jgi:(3R)-3-hydroxyacyl-CoA dehydrogenase / 3a,7a,12a-trihydroxy-5b-cholest-24-enoyl-CoA hydratase / enoyl-CoA hydratase 2
MAIVMSNLSSPPEETKPEAAPKKTEAAPQKIESPSGDILKADAIFSMMASFLDRGEGKPLIPKVASIFGFDILKTKGGKVEASYEIDLKNGQGRVTKGKNEKADALFTMTDDDFEAVCQGTLNPQIAFMQGKMKIKGNMAKATKFTPDLFPPPTDENKAKYAGAKL